MILFYSWGKHWSSTNKQHIAVLAFILQNAFLLQVILLAVIVHNLNLQTQKTKIFMSGERYPSILDFEQMHAACIIDRRVRLTCKVEKQITYPWM